MMMILQTTIHKIFLFIFGYNLKLLFAAALLIFGLWVVFSAEFSGRRLWRAVNLLLLAVSLFFILNLTILRMPTGNYYVSFSLFEKLRKIKDSYDLDREIFMNALLFFPLGLSLSQILYRQSRWKSFRNTVMIGFLLSLCIEFLQFALYCGNAEMSDLVFNTLGAVLGALPILIAGKLRNR